MPKKIFSSGKKILKNFFSSQKLSGKKLSEKKFRKKLSRKNFLEKTFRKKLSSKTFLEKNFRKNFPGKTFPLNFPTLFSRFKKKNLAKKSEKHFQKTLQNFFEITSWKNFYENFPKNYLKSLSNQNFWKNFTLNFPEKLFWKNFPEKLTEKTFSKNFPEKLC